MARIIAYPNANSPISEDDCLLGTQKDNTGSYPSNPTRNFSVGSVVQAGLGYTVYSALIDQSGTSAPSAIILKNDTGATMTWTRTGVGTYRCTASSSVFTNLKTQVFVNSGTAPNGPGSFIEWNATTAYVEINTFDINGSDADDLLDKGSFEIRIYN